MGEASDFVKDILRGMVDPRRGGSLTAAEVADRLGTATSTLYGYTGDRDLPARLVPAITLITKNTKLIEALCVACGGVFQHGPDGRSVEGYLSGAIKEFGEATVAVASGSDEALREIQEAQQALADLSARLLDEQRAKKEVDRKNKLSGGRARTLKEAN